MPKQLLTYGGDPECYHAFDNVTFTYFDRSPGYTMHECEICGMRTTEWRMSEPVPERSDWLIGWLNDAGPEVNDGRIAEEVRDVPQSV